MGHLARDCPRQARETVRAMSEGQRSAFRQALDEADEPEPAPAEETEDFPNPQ